MLGAHLTTTGQYKLDLIVGTPTPHRAFFVLRLRLASFATSARITWYLSYHYRRTRNNGWRPGCSCPGATATRTLATTAA